jgi:small subunit ribosomal protein S17
MVVKEKIGIVVSDKMVDTVIVAVSDRIIHKRYAVHDSEFNSKAGDKVRIKQTVPISKTKTWAVASILRKSST